MLQNLSVPVILRFFLQFLVLSNKNAKMTLRILQGLVQLEVCIVYKNNTNFEAFFMAKFHYVSHCPSHQCPQATKAKTVSFVAHVLL